MALRVYLGLQLPTIARQFVPRCTSCSEVLDGHGHHFLASCPGGGRLRTSRHHALVKVLGSSLSRAGYIVRREPPLEECLSPPPADPTGTDPPSRPGLRPDLLLSSVEGYQDVYVDVSVISPLRSGLLEGVATQLAYAAGHSYGAKLCKYEARVRSSVPLSAGVAPTFRSFVIKSLGCLHPGCATWLRSLFTVSTRPLYRELLLHMSVLVWRFNTGFLLPGLSAIRSHLSIYPPVSCGVISTQE